MKKLLNLCEHVSEICSEHKGLEGILQPPQLKPKAKPQARLNKKQKTDKAQPQDLSLEEMESKVAVAAEASTTMVDLEPTLESLAIEPKVQQSATADGEAGSEVQQPATDDDDDEKAAMAKLDELTSGEIKFDHWLADITIDQKKFIINSLYADHEKLGLMRSYLEQREKNETVKSCSKCRFAIGGCEQCWFSKSLNYVIRHASVPISFEKLRNYL